MHCRRARTVGDHGALAPAVSRHRASARPRRPEQPPSRPTSICRRPARLLDGLGMADDRPPAPGDLQFEHAEFAAPAGLACVACKIPIGTTYFELNGHVICEPCRDRSVAARERDSALVRFGGAAALGLAAAALGAIAWYAVREVTHLEIGLVAIVVGIAVGTAVRRGARGRGGVRCPVL